MRSTTVRVGISTPAAIAALAISLATPSSGFAFQDATPTATNSCEMVTGAATPGATSPSMGGMAMASPSPAVDMEMGIDLLYIDMMIPHHASIIAMAEAALPRLTDERLQDIARTIIDTQGAEIEELRGLREELSGSAMPMPMDDAQMTMMMELMPGMGSMDEMAAQMDAVAQVQAFCAADDPDHAFIDLTIPHHEMAIVASQAVLEQSANEEVRALAERVIADQQAEIENLLAIRGE